MKRLILLVVMLVASCPRPPSSPDEIKKRAIERATSVSTYRATLETELFSGAMSRMVGAPDAGPDDIAAMKATTTVEAWLPDRMRSTVTMSDPTRRDPNGDPSGDPVRFESVFDGTNAWVSASSGPNAQHHRVDQKLAAKGRPFDVGFNMRGGGLIEGEDLRGSILRLLTMWQLKEATPTSVAGRPCTMLKGRIDTQRAIDEALGVNGEKIAPLFARTGDSEADAMSASMRSTMAQMMGRALNEMRDANVCVASSGDVVGWSLGRDKTMLMRVTVTSFERNVTIPIERFSVDASVKSAALDVSPKVVEARTAAPVDPKALSEFRSALMSAAEERAP